MRRGLLSLATFLSLLLCVATAVLWARSYNVLYSLSRRTVDRPSGSMRTVSCSVASGRLRLTVDRHQNDDYRVAHPPTGWKLFRDPYHYAFRTDAPGPWVAGWWARDYNGDTTWGRAGARSLTVNLPVIIALTAVAPVVWRVKHLRGKRRVRQGVCRACGYDLRASPGKCPECGATPSVSISG